MLERGGTLPENYLWRATPTRVMGFTPEGELFLDTRMPRTMREALLLGYLEGWDYADALHRAYIEALETMLGDVLPREWETVPREGYPGFALSPKNSVKRAA